MFDKLADITRRYDELESLMADPSVTSNYDKVIEYSKERASLEEIVELFRTYKSKYEALEQAKQILLDENDEDLREMAKEEIAELDEVVPALEEQLKVIDRKSTRLNSSHVKISYAVFCLKKKKKVLKR